MKGKKILSAFIALVLIAGIPVTAFAADWNIAEGSITISATESGQNVSQDGGASMSDPNPVISGSSDTNTITIVADAGNTANVTLDGVNIDTSSTGEAAISTKGEGNVTIELEGDSTVKSGGLHAGVEKNNGGKLTIKDDDNDGKLTAVGSANGAGIGGGNGSASNITIKGGDITAKGGWNGAGIGGGNGSASEITISGGNVNAEGGLFGAGIGGGYRGSGSDITISGGEVAAAGGTNGAGIGGGDKGSGSDITISGDAQVKVKGGKEDPYDGAGSGIGNGGTQGKGDPVDGKELTPDTSKLTEKGKIEYYDPNSEIGKDTPRDTITGSYVPPEPEQPTEPEQPAEPKAEAAPAPGESAPLYRVTDKDGKDLAYKYGKADGVLTVTVEADYAVLTGSLSGINTLSQQGIEELVFVTNGETSTYKLAELLDMGSLSDSYALTHDGTTATLAVG